MAFSAATPLDEAWELAVQTGDLQRLWPTAAARAEAAWLAGRDADIVGLVEETYRLATKLGQAWAIGELGCWLHVAGARNTPPATAAEPWALQIGSHPRAAAHAWRELGCPYEAAAALADTDDPELMLAAIADLRGLGARPVAERLSHRLRERGVRRIPRGPRQSTMDHPAGLTRREVEILRLVPMGLRNAEIAQRLHISPRTVDRHISSIRGKLEVATRHEAAARLADLDPR
jgi:DNA-binding CsgD family transcriptional regulator